MKVKEGLEWAVNVLQQGEVGEAPTEAEILLRHVLGISRAQLYAEWDGFLPQESQRSFVELIERRLRGEPTSYLTSHREFYSFDLLVDPRVLIPRPESELLVELAVRQLEEREATTKSCLVADIGTGSGALAVALAKHLPAALVYATDISHEALEVASINCHRHGVADRVLLLQGDLLDPLPGPVDLLVSNPPYVTQAEMRSLPKEIREHEPTVALDGGRDGLEVVRRLLPQALDRLKPGGAFFMEMGHSQASKVRHLAKDLFPGARVELAKDLAGIERVLAVYDPVAIEPEIASAGISGDDTRLRNYPLTV
ncbi:MAG: peptide chain release factor N(5)-glutamine methyltransferase [Dehalococcoidia bacterium]